MKIITGSPARIEKFFRRDNIRAKILTAVKTGENLLISAPRRVGKTSILMDLVDNPDENFYAVFKNMEAIDNSDQFFKLMLQAILNTDEIDKFGRFNGNIRKKLNEWAGKIAGIKLGVFGVEFEKGEKMTAYECLCNFLKDIKLDDKKILMLVDEFPITIEKIHEAHGLKGAVDFLSENRALRQDPILQDKIKFIYTGSIGLFTAVKKLGAVDRINDLREIKIPPLNETEAETLLTDLLKEECNKLPGKELIAYILQKIEWWIPFYFQLLVRELSDLLAEGSELNEASVDKAFNMVTANGNIYFEHFKSRLSKIFKKSNESEFVTALLLRIKKESVMSYNEIVNTANKYKIVADLDNILEILTHDGYLVEENKNYKFYSPILKQWWK